MVCGGVIGPAYARPRVGVATCGRWLQCQLDISTWACPRDLKFGPLTCLETTWRKITEPLVCGSAAMFFTPVPYLCYYVGVDRKPRNPVNVHISTCGCLRDLKFGPLTCLETTLRKITQPLVCGSAAMFFTPVPYLCYYVGVDRNREILSMCISRPVDVSET